MHAASRSAKLHRMPQMQHLVIEKIVNCISRHLTAVKDFAHHDGVVRGIVVSKALARVILAPGQLWASHQAMEEARVQLFKYLLKMLMPARGTIPTVSSRHLAGERGL